MPQRVPEADLRLVRGVIPKEQLADLDRAQLEKIARVFIRAGTAGVRAEYGTLQQAAASAAEAERTLTQARPSRSATPGVRVAGRGGVQAAKALRAEGIDIRQPKLFGEARSA